MEGYLIDYKAWSRDWALQKASEQGLILQSFDWQLIEFARDFYQEYQVMPLTRRIIKFVRENLNAQFDSIELQERYSEKPLRIIALISGLPKPVQCL